MIPVVTGVHFRERVSSAAIDRSVACLFFCLCLRFSVRSTSVCCFVLLRRSLLALLTANVRQLTVSSVTSPASVAFRAQVGRVVGAEQEATVRVSCVQVSNQLPVRIVHALLGRLGWVVVLALGGIGCLPGSASARCSCTLRVAWSVLHEAECGGVRAAGDCSQTRRHERVFVFPLSRVARGSSVRGSAVKIARCHGATGS